MESLRRKHRIVNRLLANGRKARDTEMLNTNLRLCYGHGNHDKEADKEALKWLRKAAELKDEEGCQRLGHPGAEYELGGIFADGSCGVRKDFKEAVKWYRRSRGGARRR